MSDPKISVIMAEYNTKPEYLDIAIKSILNQTFKDFEFIIIDDRGTNNVTEFVKKYNDDRLKIYCNKKNMGLVYSLNKAIKHSRGSYLVRMDTDDIALPERIEKTYNFIASHREYSVVGTRAVEFSESIEYGVLGMAGEKTKRSVMRGDIIIHPSAIMRKETVLAIGGYKNIQRAEDLALWCDLLLEGYRLYVLKDILLRYRVNVEDYKKRGLLNRKYEIKARIEYYPRMGANVLDYLYIFKSVMSGILPAPAVRAYRNRFVVADVSTRVDGNYDE